MFFNQLFPWGENSRWLDTPSEPWAGDDVWLGDLEVAPQSLEPRIPVPIEPPVTNFMPEIPTVVATDLVEPEQEDPDWLKRAMEIRARNNLTAHFREQNELADANRRAAKQRLDGLLRDSRGGLVRDGSGQPIKTGYYEEPHVVTPDERKRANAQWNMNWLNGLLGL